MAVNKVIFGGETVVDLTTDTVTAAKMLSGTTAHDKSGTKVTGTIATKTASNMTVSGATVTAPAGYYASAQSKSVATATQATPSISVDSAGKIKASATQTAGYVSAGTKSATKQLDTWPEKTYTPGREPQYISGDRYLIGRQTIKGDVNLVPENIKSGVNIFGVIGTLEDGGGGGSTVATMTVNNNTDYALLVGGAIPVNPGDSADIIVSEDGNPFFAISLIYDYTEDGSEFDLQRRGWSYGAPFTVGHYDQGVVTATLQYFVSDGFYPGDVVDICMA